MNCWQRCRAEAVEQGAANTALLLRYCQRVSANEFAGLWLVAGWQL